MELSLDGTKFVKTETGWVDKKSKEPASLDYQTLLSKIEKSSAVAVPGAPSQSSNTTLPKSSSGTSKASDDIKTLDKKLVLLTKSIEKLIKTLDKQPNHQNQPAIPVEATPASVPITKETAKEVAAMKAKDPTLTSKKALEQLRERQSAQLGQPADKKPSLLKETGKEYAKSASNIVRGTVEAAFPILKPLFRANDNIKAKKQEAAEKLEKKPQGSGFKSVADAINPISSKFAAKKFTEDSEKSIQTVNISDSSIEKIAQAIKPGKEKEKDSKGLAGLFSKLENVFKSAFSVISNVIKSIVGLIATPFKAVGKLFGLGGGAKGTGATAEQLLDSKGNPLRGAAKTSREAKLVREAAEAAKITKQGAKPAAAAAAEAVKIGAKKGGLRSAMGIAGRLGLGLGALAANPVIDAAAIALTPTEANAGEDAALKKMRKEGIDPLTGKLKINKESIKIAEKAEVKVAEKAGIKIAEKTAAKAAGKQALKIGGKALLKSGLKKIPGIGLIAGGAFAAGRALKGDWSGAGLELASGAAGTIPGVGTAASIGIDAALAAKDMGAFGVGRAERPADQRDLNAEEDTRTDAMANRPPGTYVAGEPFIPGQPMSPKQRAATEMGMNMGNTPSAEIMKSYEMPAAPVKPIGMTPQSKALASANYNNAKAKDERTKSATSPSVNNYAPTTITNVSSSQGGGSSDRTVGPRGALDLPVHASPYSSMVA